MECSTCAMLSENTALREGREYSVIYALMRRFVDACAMSEHEMDSLQTVFRCNECGCEWVLGKPDFPIQGYFARREPKCIKPNEVLYEAYSENELFRFYVQKNTENNYQTVFEQIDCVNIPILSEEGTKILSAVSAQEAIKKGEELLSDAEKKLCYIYS